jgi:Histidine kinase-, DNA gyrase B-, and HSP90-like ATPase
METKMLDITPHVNLLKSLRGDRVDYVLLVGEGIDNAFDAGANSVAVIVNDSEISFADDGLGVTADRIVSIFSLGDHGAMTTTALGRFGVGIKSQAVNAGNIFSLNSLSKDGRVLVSVDWRQVLKSGRWEIQPPEWMPSVVGAHTGTTITISELRSAKAPTGGWHRKIVADAAERFYPAIAAGQAITINGEKVAALPEPELSDVVERDLALSDGRSARLRGGILVQPARLNRVHLGYKHRVIMPGSTLGCGEHGGLTKMFARVQLAGSWHLAKFKNDLTDDVERDELDDAVAEALKPILEKCNSASLSAKLIEIGQMINDLVPPELAAARPKRQKDKAATSTEARKGRKPGMVTPEKSEPLGPAKSRPRQDKLLITFEGDAEQDGIGAFQPGRPHRVNLSKGDPHIARLLEHRDQEIGVYSLYALAIALFEQGRAELPEPELQFSSFGKRIADLLSMQRDDQTITMAR